jgi:hypothetical protein
MFVRAAQGKAQRVDEKCSLGDDFSMVNEHWD